MFAAIIYSGASITEGKSESVVNYDLPEASAEAMSEGSLVVDLST